MVTAIGALTAPIVVCADTTIFLVRHAEKTTDEGDSPLSDAGHRRARDLRNVLRHVQLDAIYVSQWMRTKQTASPIATETGISPSESPDDVADFVEKLKSDHDGQDVLVVGHSDTIPQILTGLGAGQGTEIRAAYDDLFVVRITKDGDIALTQHLYYGDRSTDPSTDPQTHKLMCDASAACSLAGNMFIVANDEDNVFRIYRADATGEPIYQRDLSRDLELESDQEADIEGAARIGDRIYWIASHGRSKKGKLRPARYRLFATTVRVTRAGLEIALVGVPYERLIQDLLQNDTAQDLGLEEVTRLDENKVADLAPKKKGLNIEGLAARPNGRQLLIAFRNPRPDGKAVLVPLNNPAAVVVEGARAKFGVPILLDLGGLGIRSIDYAAGYRKFFIVAGSHKSEGPFRVFEWSGKRDDLPQAVLDIDGDELRPEAVITFRDSRWLQLLSDDGEVERDGTKCKDLVDADQKSFTSKYYSLVPN